MAITSADIRNVTFSEARRGGYNTEEVDAFLERVAEEIDKLTRNEPEEPGRWEAIEKRLRAVEEQLKNFEDKQRYMPPSW